MKCYEGELQGAMKVSNRELMWSRGQGRLPQGSDGRTEITPRQEGLARVVQVTGRAGAASWQEESW